MPVLVHTSFSEGPKPPWSAFLASWSHGMTLLHPTTHDRSVRFDRVDTMRCGPEDGGVWCDQSGCAL